MPKRRTLKQQLKHQFRIFTSVVIGVILILTYVIHLLYIQNQQLMAELEKYAYQQELLINANSSLQDEINTLLSTD